MDVVADTAAVDHGFRSLFRDWAAEMTDHPREVIEAERAHVVQNKVEAAYARSDLSESSNEIRTQGCCRSVMGRSRRVSRKSE